MLLCLVLCVAAVLPKALSGTHEAQNVEPQVGRNNEMYQRLTASLRAARSLDPLRLRKYEEGSSPIINEDILPSLSDIYISPYIFRLALQSEPENDFTRKNALLTKSLDQIGGGHLLRREAILDSIGGGHLLKRDNEITALDPIGGGHLLKRAFQLRQLDAIGGGHLLKRDPLDAIGGGHLLKRDPLDAIGGGHLLKRDPLDAIGGGHLLKRFSLDSIGGGHLLKREFEPRQLDAIGGGHLLKRTTNENAKESNLEAYVNEMN